MKYICPLFILIFFSRTIDIKAQNIFPSTGNAGIGTTTPSSPLTLQVANGAYAIRSTNGTVDIRTYQNFAFGQLGTFSNHPFQLMANNGTNQLVIMPNGNVGIGNGSPSIAGLIADTKVGATNAIFGSNTTGVAIESNYPGMGLNTYYNNNHFRIGSGYGGYIGLDPSTGTISISNTALTGNAGEPAVLSNNFSITKSGSVGIGTINPQGKFDVRGDAYINGVRVGKGKGNLAENTVLGSDALNTNTSGKYNLAVGNTASYSSTTASYNTAAGYASLYNNKTGNFNTASGYFSLFLNTGSYNTALGANALYSNTTGYSNIAVGMGALYKNTSGHNLIAIGDSALYNQSIENFDRYSNLAVGSKALFNNVNGYSNVAIGRNALYSNIEGHDMVAIGDAALFNFTPEDERESSNTAIGSNCLYNNINGFYNTGIGANALYNTVYGNGNTAIGEYALGSNVAGYSNTAIGTFADVSSANLINATAIGFGAKVNASNKVVIGDMTVNVIGGQVGWSKFSDGRFKKDIKQNVPGLEFINKLKPVTYHIEVEKFEKFLGRKDSAVQQIKEGIEANEKKLRTGLIAQEVEKAAKDIKYDFDGVNVPQNEKDNYSLVYADFVPSLIQAVQELSRMNESKDESIDSLKNQNTNQQTQLNNLQKQIDNLKAMIISSNHLSLNTSSSLEQQTVELGSAALLSQNIPNPFKNSTIINYYLPVNNGNAYINFYNVAGGLLKSVKLYGIGKSAINIKANELAAGSYRYTLIIDGKMIDSKQMVNSN